jgi:hypothetical protein
VNWIRLTALGLFFFGLALLVGCGDDGPTASKVNPNRVWVVSQTATPGDTVNVEVRIHNAVTLAGIQVPVKFAGTGFTVESVAFGDSLPASLEAFSSVDCDPEPKRVNTIWTYNILSAEYVEPGDWLFATIEVSISPEADAQEILVESYTYVGECFGITGLMTVNFAGSDLEVIEPDPSFEAGKITIVEP